eukprot:361070-Chlamydomonas_euryale.AAC.7
MRLCERLAVAWSLRQKNDTMLIKAMVAEADADAAVNAGGAEQSWQGLVKLTAWDLDRSPAQNKQGNRLSSHTLSLDPPGGARGVAARPKKLADPQSPERPRDAGLLGRKRRGWVGNWSGLPTTANARAVAESTKAKASASGQHKSRMQC